MQATSSEVVMATTMVKMHEFWKRECLVPHDRDGEG